MGILILILALALLLLARTSVAADRPNFLVIVSDDQRPDTIQALGNEIIHTLNLDRLVPGFRIQLCRSISGYFNYRTDPDYGYFNYRTDPDYDRGIFRCRPEDIPDKSKHELIYPAKYEMACMTIHGNTIVAPKYGNADPDDCGFLISPDLGKTWGHYDLKELGDRSGVRVNPPNSEGWYRLALMKRWVRKGEVMFLKPKG